MNYIVFDLEWNQALPHQKSDPELWQSLPFEVIEIGAVRFDQHLRRTGVFEATIKPVHYTKMNPFIAKVTGKKTADLTRGESFHEVSQRFHDFCGSDPVFLSWSPSDPFVFLQNCRHFEEDPPTSIEAIDLQMFFQMKIEPQNMGQQRSLENTLELLEIEKPDAFHSAFDDAVGTADVLTYLKEHQKTDDLALYRASITTTQDVRLTFSEKRLLATLKKTLDSLESVCPLCHEPLTTLPVNRSSRYQARRMAACKTHGLIRETLSKQKNDSEIWHTIHFMLVGAAFLALKAKQQEKARAAETKKTPEETS